MKTLKTITKKLIPLTFALVLMLLLIPSEVQAAKKPGQVKNLQETKATDTSVTIKFKKVSGAKKYQVQVYEASRKLESKKNADGSKTYKYKWTAKKKVIKKLDTKKTNCTIKGLQRNRSYAVKVRAYNGKTYGKWTTQYFWTTSGGRRYPGRTTATGNDLKKQYKNFKANWIKVAKKEVTSECYLAQAILDQYFESDVTGGVGGGFRCAKRTKTLLENPNEYTMDEVYATYKRGWGTDMELYHLIMDVFKTAGVECEVIYDEKKYENSLKYEGVGEARYGVVGYSGRLYDDNTKGKEGYILHLDVGFSNRNDLDGWRW